MLHDVAALKLKDNLYSLSSLHTQSNKHIFWLWTQSVPHKNWMKDCAVRHWCPVRHLKEIRNCISRIIRVSSLFCSIWVYSSLYFLSILLENQFFFIILHFLCFLPVLCWMWCNLNKLYNICIVFVYTGVR